MVFSNKTYDVLKWIAQILLPALGTLYFAVASIWGAPCAEQVVGTLTAIDVFLGAVLGISSNNYEKSDASTDGTLHIDTKNDDATITQVELNTDICDVLDSDKITLTVNPNADLTDQL
jgi:hypothetical protein